MTANEVFTSLFWIVLLGYIVYLGWSIRTWMARARGERTHDRESPKKP